jgi:hypothetical protein
MSFRGASLQDAVSAAGGEIVRSQKLDGREVITVRCEPEKLETLLKADPVQWIEPRVERRPMNDLANKRIRANSLKALHPTLTGDGVVVNLTDSGIDFRHPGFADVQGLPTSTGLNSRILAYEYRSGGPTSDGIPGDNDGHGSHVAGTILGNGALSETVIKSPGSVVPYTTNQFAGVAPRAQVVVIEDFNSFTDAEQAQTAYNRGARISNNSWGASIYDYGVMSAVWDALVRDADSVAAGNQEYIALFAAGNDGGGTDDGLGGVASTVGQPGNAKNVITVGAVEQARLANNFPAAGSVQETDSDWQISSFSSRGPVSATDKRFKPDVVAPGSYVLSVQSSETFPDDLIDPFLPHRDYRYDNLNSGANYAFFSGTSMATPVAAGGAALIYQYYTNAFNTTPSPAMMKALMVAGARSLNSLIYGFPYDNNFVTIVDQGFGLLDVERSVDGPRIHATDQVIALDQENSVGTNEVYQRQVVVAPGEGGLKIALAWTDPAGTPGNAVQLVSDIDLIVLAPGGGGYLGNQFDLDGVHSRKFNIPDPIWGDEYNNVETVLIRDAPVGTYTIQVRRYSVPSGAQDFALVIMKGVGTEGRTPGDNPSIALGADNFPIVAYADLDDAGQKQVYLKKWFGPYGDLSDLNTWKRIEDQWFGVRNSASGTGISQSIEPSQDPSVAVQGQNIYVAWTQEPQIGDTNKPDRIYFRKYDGADWVELANSAHDYGLSGVTTFDAADPVVRNLPSLNQPVVAWRQKVLTGTRPFVALFDGANWVGLAGSHTNGLPSASVAASLDMVIDSTGAPVVAWEEQTTQKIHVRRWNGSTWADLGSQGLAPYAGKPSLAAGPSGDLYLAWEQTPSGSGGSINFQIYAAKYVGGVWSAIGGSTTYPGISGSTNTATRPYSPSIGLTFNGNVIVSWQAGTAINNAVLVRRFNGASWVSEAGAGVPPGVGLTGGAISKPVMVVDAQGLPIVAFQNAAGGSNGVSEVMTYTVVGDRSPPVFSGLQTAIGGVAGDVALSWLAADDDISSNVIYHIFRSTTSVPCGTTPSCDAGNVFGNRIAIVTNSTTYTVTGLVNGQIYCFGVRAADEAGLLDGNVAMRAAGPVGGAGDTDGDCLVNTLEIQAGTEPCIRDTDADGMWDGWEWAYSTNNLAKTNSISAANTNKVYLSPVDDGVDNFRTLAPADGAAINAPFADADGDGAANIEEFQWWVGAGANCLVTDINLNVSPNPTRFDTDGDGMSDGYEIFNGLNPTINDAALDLDGDGVSNLAEYQAGGDPRTADSDGDGSPDGVELAGGTSLVIPDSDGDGLDDGDEVFVYGSNPRLADTGGNFVRDGDLVQLGLSPTGTSVGFRMLLNETFETDSPTRASWTNYAPNVALPFSFWHLSRVEPDPSVATGSQTIIAFDRHTTNYAYRSARDLTGTNLNASYSGFGNLAMALQSPMLADSITADNLFVSWLEWFETEPNADFCILQARSSTQPNWANVSSTLAGRSGVTNPNDAAPAMWIRRGADLSRYAGDPDVQIRFLFTANAINNQYKGWFVDDVRVYEAVTIEGWVRDVNGRAIEGAVVRAIGRGGVTNIVDGHRYVLPGRQMGEAKTAQDGSFSIVGLPPGNYYVKAEAASHIAEFYDGPLFTPPYAFGAGVRPGVVNRDLVTTNGWVALLSPGDVADAHFELETGSGRGCLGVALAVPNANAPVILNGQTATVWNGSASGSAALIPYVAASNLSALVQNFPDWLGNPVRPNLICDVAQGLHMPYAGTNLAFYPLPEVLIRDGERTLVEIRTNAARGNVFVTTESGGSYPIRLDGRLLTNRTPSAIQVLAGRHEVMLVNTGSSVRLAPKQISVPVAGRTVVTYTTNNINGAPGQLLVKAVDINGNSATGLSVFIDGAPLATNEASSGTPALVGSLAPGVHQLTLSAGGFKAAESRRVSIFAGANNDQTFIVYEADRDYDLVGDYTEISGYTNIFLYSRNDDPDLDGIGNLGEFDLFRLFDARVNPFQFDTDGDGMGDGFEAGYNGVSNTLALSRLGANAVAFANQASVLFAGRYLDGVDYFGSNAVPVSIAGDRFVGTVTHPLLGVPTPDPALVVFTDVATFPSNAAISTGWNAGTEVFADGRPDIQDTDGDGMWDGFEYDNGLSTLAALDVIEAGKTAEDPDADGLTNIREFLGTNNAPDLVDYTSPALADSDGDYIPDGWEYTYGFDPNNESDAFTDLDGDGLVQLGEFLSGADPRLRDTDADFLPDFEEVVIHRTDPLDTDTDDDGLLDGREVWDRNLDGVPDGGFFPNWAGGDLDNDGLVDGPTDWDTDGDGMPDGFEVLTAFGALRSPALNPYDPTDGDEDPDFDGLTSLQEFLVRDELSGNPPANFGYGAVWDYSSDPFNADSDGDGMPDGFEASFGLHPMDPVPCPNGDEECIRYSQLHVGGDPDGDGLWNLREYDIRFQLNASALQNEVISLSTHPWYPDTDGDGLGDGEEDRAFRLHPIVQDSDEDRLPDGVLISNKWGEVESAERVSEFSYVMAGLTWEQARDAAVVPHPSYTNIFGHLAIVSTIEELDSVLALGLTGANAVGLNSAAAFGAPMVPGVIVDGVITNANFTDPVDGYIIEWDDVPVATNHYDQALNDLWQLVWPAVPGYPELLPFWQRAAVDTNSPLPEGRWSSAMTYVPGYETKRPRFSNKGTILLDNRQVVVTGGRDGVNRFKDTWEFIVREGKWVRSPSPLAAFYSTGLSEVQAVPVFTDRNTKSPACPCTNMPYDCEGDTFGLPKNRPWTNSRSYDYAFLFGGWTEGHRYMFAHDFYKSTDDPRPITETNPASLGVTEFIKQGNTNAYPLEAAAQNDAEGTNSVKTFLIGKPTLAINLDNQRDTDPPIVEELATGYSAIQFDKTALHPLCETVNSATLRLVIEQAPAAEITVLVTAELRRNLGYSDSVFSSDTDIREPSARLTGGAYYRSPSVATATIYPTSTVVTADVTDALIDIISYTNWNSTIVGFVIDSQGAPDYAIVRTAQSGLSVTYTPSYKVGPEWSGAAVFTEYTNQELTPRKSAGVIYDDDQDLLVMFGGMDGNMVYGDTHEGTITYGAFKEVRWSERLPAASPSPRWGHSMVYDRKNQRVVLFGGFDQNHRPLNDLWFYSTTADTWTQFTSYRDDQIPPPRGGASMVYFGGFDYDAAKPGYCVTDRAKVVLFGGTDGKVYFNDTWVFDDVQGRWILASPAGDQSISPPPRAFASMVFAQNGENVPDAGGGSAGGDCAGSAAFLFGGRTGTLPTGRDTDFDLVEDGTEHEVGGPAAGRDPRVNAMINPDGVETIPYAYKYIGPVKPSMGRGIIANFESLRHDDPDVYFAGTQNIPYESHPDQWSLVTFPPYGGVGVDATRPEDYNLWWHQYGGENPFDSRDKWQLGRPDNSLAGSNTAPPYAYSGRWVYGTQLKGSYPNDAIMELYSPLMSFELPSMDSTSTDNPNSFFLVFHEWLDLADANDVVRIDAVRPETDADLFNRKTGLNRPVKPVLPNRNNLFNTSGRWRRTIVPLDMLANEPSVFLRFTLQSDTSGVAGGWYIDDVAVLQASEISGSLLSAGAGVEVCLTGEFFNDHLQKCTTTDANGGFGFGLLPLGNYQLVASGVTNALILTGPNLVTNVSIGAAGPAPDPVFTGMRKASPLVITWSVTNGFVYRLDYTTNLLTGAWQPLSTQAAGGGSSLVYTDVVTDAQRIYRVSVTNSP